jgi:hypothetical protein
VPYQQLHIKAGLNRTEVLPAAAKKPEQRPPLVIQRTSARPKSRVVRMPTVVTIVIAAIGLGFGIGAALTLTALQGNGAPTTIEAASFVPLPNTPPLPVPEIPVRGISSGRRLHANSISAVGTVVTAWRHRGRH